jgi:hypothetical protein
MDEFTQAQASALSGYNERDFRARVDKRIFLSTPETRATGRGRAKSFDRHEIKVASILKRISYGLTPHQEAGIADWLRRELASVHRTSTDNHPYYVILEATHGGGWRGRFEAARGRINYNNGEYVEDDDRKISVMFEDEQGAKAPANSFFAANVNAALWWDKEGALEMIFPADHKSGEASAE